MKKKMNLIILFFHFKKFLNFPVFDIKYPDKKNGRYVNVLTMDKIFEKKSKYPTKRQINKLKIKINLSRYM